MAGKQTHPYHLVEPSPMPILATIAVFAMAISALMVMHDKPYAYVALAGAFTGVVAVLYLWWKDVVREGMHDKAHSAAVQTGLRIGMALFILSEVMFFFGFFFSFFKGVLLPMDLLEEGNFFPVAAGVWPPEGTVTFDPFHLPLMNTLILLLSGTSVTWAHWGLLNGNRKALKSGLLVTVLLGVSFTILQAVEYAHAGFGFADSAYSSNFYMATGFHGFHVLVGTIFLFICYLRAQDDKQLTPEGHLGFEFAAWYWHFVDVVWLFLFVVVYIWGS